MYHPIFEIINLQFLFDNQYIASYIFTHAFSIFLWIVPPSRE